MVHLDYGRATGRMIVHCSARAEAVGNGAMRIVCSVAAAQPMHRMGVTCIRIQDVYGTDVETLWNTDARRGGMTGHDCRRHTASETICLPSGVYMAVVTFYARNSSGSDSVTCCTDPVTIES